jgi:NADH-quinone oxidoreductase subunit A
MKESDLLEYVSVVIMLALSAGFIGITMLATHLLGPKRKTNTKLEAFECGIESQGNARVPFNIKYFLVAILFVLFDVEVIFMYPWAVNFNELGITGLIEMVLFIVTMLIGFLYIVRKGALTWE